MQHTGRNLFISFNAPLALRSVTQVTTLALLGVLSSPLTMAATGTAAQPDLILGGGLKIAAKSAAWGGTISLGDSDTFLKSNGKCAFNVSYDLANTAAVGSGVFLNRIYMDGQLIGQQTNLQLAAGEKRGINTQFYLTPGKHALQLVVDADNSVAESNEDNNRQSLFVAVDSNCGGSDQSGSKPTTTAPSTSDLGSLRGLTAGGAIGGAGGKFAAWNGLIRLSTADAFLQSNGKCAFNLSYDVENTGAATAKPFINRIYSGTTLVSQQSGLMLNAGETRQILTQAYLPTGTQTLTLEIDADKTANDTQRENNLRKVALLVEGKCDGGNTPPATKADITSTKGMVIGGSVGGAGGSFGQWGGTLKILASKASAMADGKCVFNVSYDMENLGNGGSNKQFVNRLFDGDRLAAEQGGLTINVGESRLVNSQIALLPGTHTLRLQLDADKQIDESNESNDSNVKLLQVWLDGQCKPQTSK